MALGQIKNEDIKSQLVITVTSLLDSTQ
jgi:hypothetical protein